MSYAANEAKTDLDDRKAGKRSFGWWLDDSCAASS
jgi:hypothetical protein